MRTPQIVSYTDSITIGKDHVLWSRTEIFLNGKLVFKATPKMSTEQALMLMGFLVPKPPVKTVVAQAIESGFVPMQRQ